mgnify:CR=1 FL=1
MDLKAFASLGVHGCSAITCLTAQNTKQITRVDAVPSDMLREQLHAIMSDMNPEAAKTGAIYTAENGEVIAEMFSDQRVPLIIDPVDTYLFAHNPEPVRDSGSHGNQGLKYR